MGITFCDVPLLLMDPEGVFQRFIDRHLSLEDLRLFSPEPVAIRDGRHRPRGYIGRDEQTECDTRWAKVGIDGARVGLPTWNWSGYGPPHLRINTLWWPTGASRFSLGLFLGSDVELEKITEAIGSDGNGTLLLEADAEHDGKTFDTVETPMYLLAPVCLTGREPIGYGGNEERVWLLPLVDVRYFWQRTSMLPLEVTTGSSWSGLMALIGTALGVSIDVDSASGGYAGPDPVELTRRYENAAVLADAVAACLGQRIVRDLNGRVHSQGHADATTQHTANKQSADDDPKYLVAGGVEATGTWSLKPSQVRVVFPRYQNDIPQMDGNVWAVTVAGDSAGKGIKTFFDTAQADFTGGSGPHNGAELAALTAAIAADHLAWIQAPHHLALAGLAGWIPTGYDDYVWWHAGVQKGALTSQLGDDFGDYVVCTRVAGLPMNFGIEELLHQFGPSQSSSSSSSEVGSSASSSSEVGSSSSTTSGGPVTIDVLICEPWNRCSEYLVFPQRRIHLPPGSSISTLPNAVVPLGICESSQPPPPSDDPPSDSVGDSSSGALGTPWTDDDIFWDYLVVTGLITPAAALGGYSCGAGYYNGRPFWFKYSEDGSWMIYWNPAMGGCWQIRHIGDAVNFWYKYDNPNSPTGDYNASPFATGVAEVSVGGPP